MAYLEDHKHAEMDLSHAAGLQAGILPARPVQQLLGRVVHALRVQTRPHPCPDGPPQIIQDTLGTHLLVFTAAPWNSSDMMLRSSFGLHTEQLNSWMPGF
eukprot:scaffold327210_cov43-Prasinocladus_malaysianus.AAC.1